MALDVSRRPLAVRSQLFSAITDAFVVRSLLVFGVAFATRIFFVLLSPFWAGDSSEYHRIALNLAAGNGYSLIDATPTVTRPPVYPLFIAAIYELVGVIPGAVLFTQAVVGGLTSWLVYVLGRRLIDDRAAALGGGLAAASPHLAAYAGTLLSETVATFLLVITILLVLQVRGTGSGRVAVLLGLSAGALALTAPRFALLPIALLGWLALGHLPRRFVLRSVFFVGAGYLLVLSPWVARNAMVFSAVIPFTVNKQAVPLWAAAARIDLYNYSAVGELARTEPLLARLYEVYSVTAGPEPELLAERRRLDEALTADAWRRIAEDPGAYIRHRLQVVPYLWIQPAAYAGHFVAPFSDQNDNLSVMIQHGRWSAVALRSLSILVFTVGLFGGAAMGMWILRRRWRDVSLFYLPAVYLTAIHAPLWIEHRYSIPAHPFLWLIAGLGIAHAWGSILGLRSQRSLHVG